MAVKRFKKIILLILAAVLVVTSAPGIRAYAGDDTESLGKTGDIPADYKLVTESDDYELYLYKDTMSVILRDKKTGKALYSAVQDWEDDKKNNKTWNAYIKSGIVIQAIKGTTDTYQADLVSSKKKISYEFTDKGFRATIYWTDMKFGLDVVVELNGNEFTVTVPDDSIKEDSNQTFIGSISLFPMLGHTYLDAEKGYILIPDGNGALIYLNDKDGRYSSGFSQVIYGTDAGFTESKNETLLMDKYDSLESAEKVIAPIFGMIHTDDALGYLGVVEDGALRCSVEAAPNGVMIDYNRCYARFTLRKVYVQPLNNSNSGTVKMTETERSHSDLQVRYILVNGENADYSGLANVYRDYLYKNGAIEKKDVTYKTRIDFLGSERENFLFTTKPVVMTTVSDIEEIFEDLKNNGVERVFTVYKGWQSGGLYDLPITKYKADSSIGGTSELTKLIKSSSEKGYDIYLYNNALMSNPKTSNTTFNAVKKINKRKLEVETKAMVYGVFNYVLPEKMSTCLSNFIKSYTSKGVSNLAVSGASNNVYSWYLNGTYYDRFDCEKIYTKMIEDACASANLVLEKPYEYFWKYTDAFLDMPLGSSDYMYEDEEVPFLSMVLKGSIPMYSDYVNFEANKTEFILKMAEAGIYPSFYITKESSADLIYTNSSDLYSTKYTTYRDRIIEYDRMFSELAKETEDAYILHHDRLSDTLTKVTYSNDVTVYVNYGEEDVTVAGAVIPALSAKAVK